MNTWHEVDVHPTVRLSHVVLFSNTWLDCNAMHCLVLQELHNLEIEELVQMYDR